MALDGSHTPAKNGGEAVVYQGVILSMSPPQAGNHHDLFEINTLFEQMFELLKQAEIAVEGLFLNGGVGF
jgi:hypothetical protein